MNMKVKRPRIAPSRLMENWRTRDHVSLKVLRICTGLVPMLQLKLPLC